MTYAKSCLFHFGLLHLLLLLVQIETLRYNELYDSLQVDAALIATGRAPFTQGLGLENVSEVDIDIFQLYMQINFTMEAE